MGREVDVIIPTRKRIVWVFIAKNDQTARRTQRCFSANERAPCSLGYVFSVCVGSEACPAADDNSM